MAIIFDDDIFIHIIAAPGQPGDGFTAPEAATLRSDIDTLLSRPVINGIDDVPGVTVSSPTAGQMLVFDGSGNLANSDVARGLASVQRAGSNLASDITTLNFNSQAFGVTWSGGGLANINVVWGGTGTADAFARSDHTHGIASTDREFSIAASGTLSGGTRPLVSGSVTGLDPAKTYIIKGTLYLHVRGDGTGASYVRPRVTIGGLIRDGFEDTRGVAGVLITEATPHGGLQIGGVSSVAVSASVSFQPGDPAYIGGGILIIDVQANR